MKDYTSVCPPFDSQYSAATHVDAQDCVEESFVHIVFMLTGKRYSPRALAYLTDVKPTGSSVSDCIKAVNKYGLIPYNRWPSPDVFTWESYYEPIPAQVLASAEFYDVSLLPPNLDVSPLWTEIAFDKLHGTSLHMVAQINDTHFFDSELGSPIKPIDLANSKIMYQTSIKLISKNMAEFVHINGSSDYGLLFNTEFVTTIVKFTSPEDAKDKLKNVPGALHSDGSVNFESARVIIL